MGRSANLRLSYRPVELRSVMGGRNRATDTGFDDVEWRGLAGEVRRPDGASPPVRRIPCPEASRPVPTACASSVLGRQRVAAIRSPAVEDGGTGWAVPDVTPFRGGL
jgi:hypothetical protein